MIRKIRALWRRRNQKKPIVDLEKRTYTYAELRRIAEEYGDMRYNDGKRDGLAVAREQATKSLKEILWQQNRTSQK